VVIMHISADHAVQFGRLAAPTGVTAAVLAGTALVAVIDPEQPGHYPTCPFLALTGHWCPGCGSLRALHALTRGDVGLALHRNLLLVVLVPVAVWALAAWIRRRIVDRPADRYPPVWAWWAGLVVIVAFGVARNLPWFAVLAP
jgi:hypothetical protein